MYFRITSRTALPGWAVVLALLTLSPLPLTVPSGIALAAIGLMGLLACCTTAQVYAPIVSQVRAGAHAASSRNRQLR